MLRLEQCIDEGSDSRALGEDNEAAEQDKDNDDGGHPEYLSLFDKLPEVFQKIYHQNGFSMLVW